MSEISEAALRHAETRRADEIKKAAEMLSTHVAQALLAIDEAIKMKHDNRLQLRGLRDRLREQNVAFRSILWPKRRPE